MMGRSNEPITQRACHVYPQYLGRSSSPTCSQQQQNVFIVFKFSRNRKLQNYSVNYQVLLSCCTHNNSLELSQVSQIQRYIDRNNGFFPFNSFFDS